MGERNILNYEGKKVSTKIVCIMQSELIQTRPMLTSEPLKPLGQVITEP